MTPPRRFPPDLLAEITTTLQSSLAPHSGDVEQHQLEAMTKRVCTHAHSAGMSPEGMVIALREAYESVGTTRASDEVQLRILYDRVLEGCLTAYFKEQARPAT